MEEWEANPQLETDIDYKVVAGLLCLYLFRVSEKSKEAGPHLLLILIETVPATGLQYL